MKRLWTLAILVLGLVGQFGCASPPRDPPQRLPPQTIVEPPPPPVVIDAAPPQMIDAAPPPPSTNLTVDDAAAILAMTIPESCSAPATVECLIADRYKADPAASKLALAIYAQSGAVAGVGADEVMDGSYRGKIQLVSQLPTGRYRPHLQRVARALVDLETTFAALQASAPDAEFKFRWRDVALHFVRSPGKTTPSAYALGFAITYNVEGSLLRNDVGVRDTLVHELFHSNDVGWSKATLSTDYAAIVARCSPKLSRECLAKYAPGTTTVRGGTYYAFQPNNGAGVGEYAAELALRYIREQRAMLADGKLTSPAFKCGAPENERSWNALVTEYFDGVDLVPACEPSP